LPIDILDHSKRSILYGNVDGHPLRCLQPLLDDVDLESKRNAREIPISAPPPAQYNDFNGGLAKMRSNLPQYLIPSILGGIGFSDFSN
jgi:hypothetical protein